MTTQRMMSVLKVAAGATGIGIGGVIAWFLVQALAGWFGSQQNFIQTKFIATIEDSIEKTSEQTSATRQLTDKVSEHTNKVFDLTEKVDDLIDQQVRLTDRLEPLTSQLKRTATAVEESTEQAREEAQPQP